MAPFARRFGPAPEGAPVSHDAPDRVRAGLVHILENAYELLNKRSVYGSHEFGIEKQVRFDLRTPGKADYNYSEQFIDSTLFGTNWLDFYTFIESVNTYLTQQDYFVASEFRKAVDGLLSDEAVVYRFGDQSFLVAGATKEFVEATSAALSSAPPLFANQLRRALEKLRVRSLEPENAVKDAVGALHGVVAQTVSRKANTLGDLGNALKSKVHPTLAGSIDALLKLEAFRGDKAAHAATPEGISIAEATFVVHQCAAAIAFLSELKRDTFDPDEIPF